MNSKAIKSLGGNKMKFVINRDRLLKSLNDVMKAISSRAAIPILTGVKIEADQQGITLTGSDSNISIESFIPIEENGKVNIQEIVPGQVVLQASYFPEVIRKLPEKTVEVEVDEQLNVKIISGNALFNLNGQDADEYPQLPQLQANNTFNIASNLLKGLINQTVFAISTMETRPILTGVNIKFDDQKLSFTATDSHRLALKEIPLDTEIDLPNIVVPGKSLTELVKILDDTNDPIEVSVTNNLILFKTNHLKFLSRLLDGNYPDTSRLIPSDGKTELRVTTKQLINTIDRASLLAKDERNNVVTLTTKDDQIIEITSSSTEVGKVTEELTTESISGEELKISFSAKYMLEALKAVEADEVIIHFTGAMRPFVIRPANEDPITQLITPVRTF